MDNVSLVRQMSIADLFDVDSYSHPFSGFNYREAAPPAEITSFQRQVAKRHFGVHGYFTKQVWSVVQAYINAFTQPGDVILDPFGGSGVTAIEALMLGRRAIHVDLNPLSQFIVQTLLTPVDFKSLEQQFNAVMQAFAVERPRSDEDIQRILAHYDYPRGIRLPRNADVETIEQLFTPKQLAELALLKHLIGQCQETAVRQHLLLMFSGLLNKINRTYHASAGRSEGRGDSAMFRYYRYRIAHSSPELEITTVFQSRFKKVLAAKMELLPITGVGASAAQSILQGSATDLYPIRDESVDYIYTDPPYGSKIPYLDLSIMWNTWLGLHVSKDNRAEEAIEGGENKKTKADYFRILAASIEEMYRVLKYDCWLSFVFAHSDPSYWHMIVVTAEKAGFEYVSVTRQNNGQHSFKKRQNPFSVLSGQLILNFRKLHNPKRRKSYTGNIYAQTVIMATTEAVIERHNGATVEQINDALVIQGLELDMLNVLSQHYDDLTPLLRKHFDCGCDGRWYLRGDKPQIGQKGSVSIVSKTPISWG